jgi:hypothetical protein
MNKNTPEQALGRSTAMLLEFAQEEHVAYYAILHDKVNRRFLVQAHEWPEFFCMVNDIPGTLGMAASKDTITRLPGDREKLLEQIVQDCDGYPLFLVYTDIPSKTAPEFPRIWAEQRNNPYCLVTNVAEWRESLMPLYYMTRAPTALDHALKTHSEKVLPPVILGFGKNHSVSLPYADRFRRLRNTNEDGGKKIASNV